ncbi:hypothetical protein CK203_109825 [Vitis vinifera]|uniref:Uncharacterized protein n=1 Tax=Vitis vinifera TaxID=29760 RepID=A0A438CFJ4_VITVI|nr:hypothetical protein CK203_109825 [Vitis vinifera]
MRQAIEKRQLASEKQLRALLQETERLREENAVLRIQASTSGPPRRQRSKGQVANSRPEPESIYPGSTGAVPGTYNTRPHEPRTPMPRAPLVKFYARKTRPTRAWEIKATSSHNPGATPDPMIAPMVQNVPPHRDPMVTPAMRKLHSHLAERPAGRNLPNEPPIGSISKSWMTCSPRPFALISPITSPQEDSSYQSFPLRWTNDPFDHIMHYRQLMTLDIGNDALLCKDLSEAFVDILMLCSTQAEYQHPPEHKNERQRILEGILKRFGQAVLQIEVCSMDAVLQIFKRSICPGTPFSNRWQKTSYNDGYLFRRANKYSMLEDDYVQPLSKF